MKTISTAGLAVIATIAMGQAVNVGSRGYGFDSPVNKLYDRSHQVVFTGRVTGKSIAAPAEGMGQAENILVKVSKGQTILVELGPQWFVSNQVAKVNIGDKVRVIGSQITIGGTRLVLAKNVVNTRNNRVLAVRDFGGNPYWIAARQVPKSSIPADSIGGTILSTNTVNMNGTPYSGYVLQTPTGNINVITAPQWYTAGQDYVIPVGTYLNVVGGPGPIDVGNHVVIANQMYSNGYQFTYFNNGTPVWYGYGR